MNNDFRFRLKARGGVFNTSTELATSLGILYNYSSIFSYCMDCACDKFVDDGSFFAVTPKIELQYAKRGSLTSLFFVDFPAAYVMLQNIIGQYSWDLFKDTFEFVKILGTIKSRREVPEVHVVNSPGAQVTVIVGDNNSVSVTPDVLGSAKRNVKYISGLAGAVGPLGASTLGISRVVGKNGVEPGGVLLNEKNKFLYSDLEQEHVLEETREYPANIYRLNTKNRTGLADVGGKSVSFEIEDGEITPYIEALHGETCILRARAKMMINQFGESRLDHLFVSGITPLHQ